MDKIEYLKQFYNSLHNNLIKAYKKERYKSVFIWFLEIKSNDRLHIMRHSYIKKESIPRNILNILVNDKFISETDSMGGYAITAKGVWEYEKQNNIISHDALIEYLDAKYFDTYSETTKPFSDRHKIIIFSMIAARAFSEFSPVDLKKEEFVLTTWEQIINKSYEMLHSLDIVSNMTAKGLYGKKGNEHKVSNLIRHSDEIPKRTKGIYKTAKSRDQKYYLDLYKDGKINTANLKFLLRQVFGNKKLSHSEIDNLCVFFNDISAAKSIYVFDIKEHKFHNPKYDIIIRDALLTL